MEQLYEEYAWVSRGRQRQAVIKALFKPMTPTELRKKSVEYNKRISLSNVSDVLRHFVRHGLAECMNPEVRTGRLYRLTDIGEEVRTLFVKSM